MIQGARVASGSQQHEKPLMKPSVWTSREAEQVSFRYWSGISQRYCSAAIFIESLEHQMNGIMSPNIRSVCTGTRSYEQVQVVRAHLIIINSRVCRECEQWSSTMRVLEVDVVANVDQESNKSIVLMCLWFETACEMYQISSQSVTIITRSPYRRTSIVRSLCRATVMSKSGSLVPISCMYRYRSVKPIQVAHKMLSCECL